MSTSKLRYKQLCQKVGYVPLFLNDWWLDAVCGAGHWDVVIHEKGMQPIAAFPVYQLKKSFFRFLLQPPLTPRLGPLIHYPPIQKEDRRLSFEHEVHKALIKALPKHAAITTNLDYSANWLEFAWNGFEVIPRISYVIDDLSDQKRIFDAFDTSLRGSIRKAEKTLSVRSDLDILAFYEVNKMTFERKGRSIPYSFSFIEQLDQACARNNCRKLFFAVDNQDNIHAATYLVWDEKCAYYLMGGINPKFKTAGATALLIREAIRYSATVVDRFDFEGSMIPSVEKFFRTFGASRKTYYQVKKTNNTLWKLRNLLKK